MKVCLRLPSLQKRIATRTSPARWVRHSPDLKATRGWGWLTNPRKAAYNRFYNRTTFGLKECGWLVLLPATLAVRWFL